MKYLITFLLLNSFLSPIYGNEIPYRIRQDFISRQNENITINNYRNEEELIQFIESTIETHLIPGLSISIVKDDNIVWEKYFGYANIDENIIVDEDTMFILSSVSKTVTATALMQLFEDGLFSLDLTVVA